MSNSCPTDNAAPDGTACADADACTQTDEPSTGLSSKPAKTADADNDGSPDCADACPDDPANDVDGDGLANADEAAAGTDLP